MPKLNNNIFRAEHFETLNEALYISEEITTNYFLLNNKHWMKNPYEILTLKDVSGSEHPGKALAHLVRYVKDLRQKKSGSDDKAFYRICLNDNRILKKTFGGAKDRLLPLFLYIMTHELVHIARFILFASHPVISAHKNEERLAHGLTCEILKPLRSMKSLAEVTNEFRLYLH